MTLRPLTHGDLQRVRNWRNATRESLRTPHLLTEAMQERFAAEVVDNPASPHRYFAIVRGPTRMVGIGGLTYISWIDGIAEISLLIAPALAGKGLGAAAVHCLLEEAFDRMRLVTVVGEVYRCNSEGTKFWKKVIAAHGGEWTTLPRRKLWAGQLWSSIYFTLTIEKWRTQRKPAD